MAALGVAINVLLLASSIYMMLIYDRVLPSQSVPTLLSLLLMVTIVYAFQGVFEAMRTKMLADVGASLDEALSHRVRMLEMRLAIRQPDAAANPLRDLDQVRGFLAGPGPPALLDLPWIIFFLAVLALVHLWLGVVTLAGVLVLAGLAFATERVSAGRVASVATLAGQRAMLARRDRQHAEVIDSLGMRERLLARWQGTSARFLAAQRDLTDRSASLAATSRMFRVFLQSLVLTVGALLVIDGKASGGVIFASSILAGRALAPVDQAIANWRGFVATRQSWARLDTLLDRFPPEAAPPLPLPAPSRSLSVERLTLAPPGSQRTVVADVRFALNAGEAVAIVGPSASGKSSLLRGIIGVWPALRGEVRLDGAALDQWAPQALGRQIGYLPQSIELFAGSVRDNIARFDPDAPADAVIAAATAAGVHQLVLQLPDGYDTEVGEDGHHLSAGQRQRIALARALYGEPFLVVLDEPNSNLDPEGEEALARAITGVRQRGGIVLLVAHRMTVLKAVDLVLVMRAGQAQAFGPRDEILARFSAPPAAGGLASVARI